MYEHIDLKDMSWKILQALEEEDGVKAADLSERLGLKVRQVDAAITKSLVRYGLVERRAQFTRLQKKTYNLIFITSLGKNYAAFRREHDQKVESRYILAKQEAAKAAEKAKLELREKILEKKGSFGKE